MTEILSIFSGNPLATFIGKKIEAATRPELESEDWALNLEICDMINENDDDAKDAVRAIKKRLQQIEQDRNFTITNRTLTVLETCVSNCSRRFHVLVMTKDFIQDLVKLIGPKNNPPIDLQERVLRLIERWAEAFKNQPELGGVVAVYNDLKSKGVTFPPKDPSSNVPIQTPQRSVPPLQPPVAVTAAQTAPQPIARSPNMMTNQMHQVIPPPQPSGPIVLEGEGYHKISQDLGVVQSSIDMFNEIMGVLESSNNDESDWKLAADLDTTCRQMKDRIVDLIERVANEDLTIELLRLNDDLNNIFVKYDRLVKNRAKSTSQPASSSTPITAPSNPLSNPLSTTATTTAAATSSSSSTTTTTTTTKSPISSRTINELSLIDFNADYSGERAGSSVATGQKDIVDPFDSSAVAKEMSKPTKPSSSQQHQSSGIDPLVGNLNQLNLDGKINKQQQGKGNLPEEISSVREQDFAEIENWLASDSGRNQPLASGGDDLSSIEPISIPNSEFENFIASRALAGSSVATPSQTSKPSHQHKPEPSV